MRTILVVVGVIVVLIGIGWVLQGAGVLLGSFMSNNPTWLGIGIVTAILGAALLVIGIRYPARSRKPDEV